MSEIVSPTTSLAPIFFILLIILISGILFVIYSIGRLKQNSKQILRTLGLALLISAIVSAALALFISQTAKIMVDCVNPPCTASYGKTDLFFESFIKLLPIFFFINTVIIYLIKMLKSHLT